jgi:enoyl-CoA hydratase/carnithine racemase
MIQEKIEDGVLIATFANGKNNSMNADMVKQLQDIVKKVNTEDDIKGLVLTGEGRTFCSGFDLPMFLGFKDLDEVIAFFNEAEDAFIELFACKKPVVSAINGAAVAGGLIMAMACDYRIIKNHPKIKVGMSEIKIGLGLSIVQSEIMKYGLETSKRFQEVLYGGNLYDIQSAKDNDIVDEIVEEDELISRAKAVVSSWIDNPGRAFIMLKHGLRCVTAERMRDRVKNENWQEGFNIFFDPGTRGALEMVSKMMGN